MVFALRKRVAGDTYEKQLANQPLSSANLRTFLLQPDEHEQKTY